MAMKLVVAVVQNEDADDVIDALTAAHYGATRMASTGGFLRQGNTTIIVGVPDEAVENVLNIITQHSSRSRRQVVTNPFPDSTAIASRKYSAPDAAGPAGGARPQEVQVGGAAIFVLNLDRYERI